MTEAFETKVYLHISGSFVYRFYPVYYTSGFLKKVLTLVKQMFLSRLEWLGCSNFELG